MLLYIYKLYIIDKWYEDKCIILKFNFILFVLLKKKWVKLLFFLYSFMI